MTKKEIDFCMKYIETRNAKSSALAAGYSQFFAQKKSYTLVKKHAAFIEEKEAEFYTKKFKRLASIAIKELENVIKSDKNDSAKINAIRYALEVSKVLEAKEEHKPTTIKVTLPREFQGHTE